MIVPTVQLQCYFADSKRAVPIKEQLPGSSSFVVHLLSQKGGG